MKIETSRLVLRPFRDDDLEAFARLNADPEVMRFFPAPYTRAQTGRMLEVFAEKRARHGYAFSAVERRSDGALIGMAGLSRFEAAAPIAPCTEIGWRLAHAAWGQGYATEAARAWLAWGFGPGGIGEILSFAPKPNLASQRVMQRIGMQRAEALDFDHPAIPDGHALRRMAVWRLRRAGAAPVSG